jgi:hypothetical protein
VEEEISRGRQRLWQRKGATDGELRYAALDINTGMLFSNVVMYFVILANAATLQQAGRTNIGTAPEAAEALRPLAGQRLGDQHHGLARGPPHVCRGGGPRLDMDQRMKSEVSSIRLNGGNLPAKV